MPKQKNAGSDLQGIVRLITDSTIGLTHLVEEMHRQVVHPPVLPSTGVQHLITNAAGVAYKSIRWSTRLIGNGVDKLLGQLSSAIGEMEYTPDKEAMRAVLNGVLGDYLAESKNPLNITMKFRHKGIEIPVNSKSIEKAYAKVNGKILLMVHGSCLDDIQWTRNEHNHGLRLAKELKMTPIYLHYNSGRHISTNGQDFNKLLEKLIQHWPVPVEELNIIAHSMGGLLTRSAFYYGSLKKKSWTSYLKKIVFLGTPHHGAPLEKAGNYLDMILESIPYARPFARLGKVRSAGVTDLRYGNLIDEDWQNINRFKVTGDQRKHIPLPKQVACYCVAGIASKKSEALHAELLGDNLVNVKSALGEHKDPHKTLHFKKKNTWLAYKSNHSDLLSNPKVYKRIKKWMAL